MAAYNFDNKEFESEFWSGFDQSKTLKNALVYFATKWPYHGEEIKQSFADIVENHIINKNVERRKLLDLIDLELESLELSRESPKPKSKEQTHRNGLSVFDADRLDGNAFQDFIAELLPANGYLNVQVTGKSGDQGGDLVAQKDDEELIIQAKRFSIDRKVTNKAVQEALGAIGYYNANKGVVVTNSFYTQSAIELAEINNITLWDRNDLSKFIEKYNASTGSK